MAASKADEKVEPEAEAVSNSKKKRWADEEDDWADEEDDWAEDVLAAAVAPPATTQAPADPLVGCTAMETKF